MQARSIRFSVGLFTGLGLWVGDERVEARDELAVAVGRVDPSSLVGVAGERVDVDAL